VERNRGGIKHERRNGVIWSLHGSVMAGVDVGGFPCRSPKMKKAGAIRPFFTMLDPPEGNWSG